MQFKLKLQVGPMSSRTTALGLAMLASLLLSAVDVGATQATSKAKPKHPKGFVHDTAGDGIVTAESKASYGAGGTPKWIQYDWGGLYYYQHNEPNKARSYWMESFKLAELDVPAIRARGLDAKTAEACCNLIKHLSFFVADSKFKPNYDSSYFGNDNFKGGSQAVSPGTNTTRKLLDDQIYSLKKMMEDWEWYERICNFANRAIGKQRDCMRQIYSQRSVFERKIIMCRQQAREYEKALGIDAKNSSIDFRPLRWDGIPGAGNPFNTPSSNPLPIELRGGADPRDMK